MEHWALGGLHSTSAVLCACPLYIVQCNEPFAHRHWNTMWLISAPELTSIPWMLPGTISLSMQLYRWYTNCTDKNWVIVQKANRKLILKTFEKSMSVKIVIGLCYVNWVLVWMDRDDLLKGTSWFRINKCIWIEL